MGWVGEAHLAVAMGNPEIPILFEPLHAFRRLHPPSVLYVPFIKKSSSMTDTTIFGSSLTPWRLGLCKYSASLHLNSFSEYISFDYRDAKPIFKSMDVRMKPSENSFHFLVKSG